MVTCTIEDFELELSKKGARGARGRTFARVITRLQGICKLQPIPTAIRIDIFSFLDKIRGIDGFIGGGKSAPVCS